MLLKQYISESIGFDHRFKLNADDEVIASIENKISDPGITWDEIYKIHKQIKSVKDSIGE